MTGRLDTSQKQVVRLMMSLVRPGAEDDPYEDGRWDGAVDAATVIWGHNGAKRLVDLSCRAAAILFNGVTQPEEMMTLPERRMVRAMNRDILRYGRHDPVALDRLSVAARRSGEGRAYFLWLVASRYATLLTARAQRSIPQRDRRRRLDELTQRISDKQGVPG